METAIEGLLALAAFDVGFDTAFETQRSRNWQAVADLIIMASAKGDFPDKPFGPNPARVVRNANCSVLVHRG